jgi:putative SOS response-associated peptidase YedK
MTSLIRARSRARAWTLAVITTDANELVADIHDRMPVIVAPSDYARWLDLDAREQARE